MLIRSINKNLCRNKTRNPFTKLRTREFSTLANSTVFRIYKRYIASSSVVFAGTILSLTVLYMTGARGFSNWVWNQYNKDKSFEGIIGRFPEKIPYEPFGAEEEEEEDEFEDDEE
ncbi:hypothetical protein MHBO_000989 [Bonamia ostreae]|uniref:Uncharacterized protein n=1 Tax=Bonamia ostreae TaxID=126728 RepID=A0ABV2AI59_9EUKA